MCAQPPEAGQARDETSSCAGRWRKISVAYSPEQIVGRLRPNSLTNPEMRVSPETIYQSLSSSRAERCR